MSDSLTEFAKDLLVVLRKHAPHAVAAAQEDMDAWRNIAPPVRYVIHMIGFQNAALSEKCIESIIGHSPAGKYKLILTNNGSTDRTQEVFDHFDRLHDEVVTFTNPDNQGFQKPNERAFALAKSWGATYYVLINNDAVVPANWLEMLEKPLERWPLAAVSGPRGGSTQLSKEMQGCGGRLEYIEFSCAMLKVALISDLGPTLFSPYLDFIYCEDSDLCLRAQFAGFSIHQVPFHLEHGGSKTCQHIPEAKDRCAAAEVANRRAMMKRWRHWNMVRKFDFPIVIRRKYALGDVLLTTPIIRALKRRYRLSKIYVECNCPEVVAGSQGVFAASTIEPYLTDAMVINLDMAYEDRPEMHYVDAYAQVAEIDPITDRQLEIQVHDEEIARFQGTLAARRTCVIHASRTGWGGRDWPEESFRVLIADLRAAGWYVVRIGSNDDYPKLKCETNLCGKTNIRSLAALLRLSQLFIGIDSFPLHVAQAVGTPAVGIFGITHPKYVLTSPRAVGVVGQGPDVGLRHRIVGKQRVDGDPSCIATVTVPQVLAAVELVLQVPPTQPT